MKYITSMFKDKLDFLKVYGFHYNSKTNSWKLTFPYEETVPSSKHNIFVKRTVIVEVILHTTKPEMELITRFNKKVCTHTSIQLGGGALEHLIDNKEYEKYVNKIDGYIDECLTEIYKDRFYKRYPYGYTR